MAPLLIVIPCYNEAARLQVETIQRFLSAGDIGVVFVDDGSRDSTREVLHRIREAHPLVVQVLAMPVNRGKAEAVRHGIDFALQQQPEYVGYWDADLATPLPAIYELLDLLERRPDIDMVFGARVKLLGRRIDRRAARHYLGRTFATVVSVMLRLPIYDTQCGAKIFRLSDRTRPIFKEPFLSRWVFDVELIARYVRTVGSPAVAAARIYEYPLQEWADIGGSKLKTRDFFVALWDVVRIWRKYLYRV